MKRICSVLPLVACIAGPAVCDDRVIPLDSLFLCVDTSDARNHQGGGNVLRVVVGISKSKDSPRGDTFVEARCIVFPPGKRLLSENDLKAFHDVAAAAANGIILQKEVQSKVQDGEEVTTFAAKRQGGIWSIQMRRSDVEAQFTITEANRVMMALRQARVGEAWFKKLLVANRLPEHTPEAKPPASNGYYLSSMIGQVSGGGLTYELLITSRGVDGGAKFGSKHRLRFLLNDGQPVSASGPWVEALFGRISEALDAVQKEDDYLVASSEKGEPKYTVFANLEAKTADVTLIPGEFFRDNTAKNGSFGLAQLGAIREFTDVYESRKRWLESHAHLFWTTGEVKTQE